MSNTEVNNVTVVEKENASKSDLLLLVETLTSKNKGLEAELKQVIDINKELSDEVIEMMDKYNMIVISIQKIKDLFITL